MTTQPSNELPCDPVRESQRQWLIDDLFRLSGRSDPSHPMHNLYTGLYQEWRAKTANEPAP